MYLRRQSSNNGPMTEANVQIEMLAVLVVVPPPDAEESKESEE